jgi:hypothetical protein
MAYQKKGHSQKCSLVWYINATQHFKQITKNLIHFTNYHTTIHVSTEISININSCGIHGGKQQHKLNSEVNNAWQQMAFVCSFCIWHLDKQKALNM